MARRAGDELEGVSSPDVSSKTLNSALRENGLDEEYWSGLLESVCAITEYRQLQFRAGSIYQVLQKHVRYDSEKNALKNLLGVANTYKTMGGGKKTKAESKGKKAEKGIENKSDSLMSDKDLVAALERVHQGNLQDLYPGAIDLNDLETIPDTIPQTEYQNYDASLPEKGTHAYECLDLLGLTEYYPSRISLQDVMTVGRICKENEKGDLSNVPWLILQKLIMLDYNGRDSYLSAAMSKDQRGTTSDASDENDEFSFENILHDIDSDETDDMTTLNPLDVIITIYSCCDLLLKQTIAQKMFLCRLALPFICPQLAADSLILSLWALRSITVEWKGRDQTMCETSVANHKMKIVSFIRLGKPSCSKSILLNNVISDQAHNTFWNRECPLGHTEYCLADGLVEATWYLPAGKPTDTFQEATTFLNLRGDACKLDRQWQTLCQISNVMVCCIETTDLENQDVLDTMKHIHGCSSNVVLFLTMKEAESAKQESLKKQYAHYVSHIGKSNMANTKEVSGFRKGRVKTVDDTRKELRQAIHRSLQDENRKSIEDASKVALKMGIDIDEYHEFCQKGKKYAARVISCMEGKAINECKAEMLPLQGSRKQEWSKLLRKKHQLGGKDVTGSLMQEVAAIEEKMVFQRKKQLQDCIPLSALMKIFQKYLLETKDSPTAILYMQWLKIHLDEMSRKNVPGLHKEYNEKWFNLNTVKEDTDEGLMKATELRKELKLAEQLFTDSSLGVEHLLRELAQIYEAAVESGLELQKETKNYIRQLPETAAKLLLKGQSMEIMDGDASNVPLTWIRAVMSNLVSLVGDKRLFVISVLGIQSSGKSTLLNTMFGLEFAVSAGRCTHGAFMQLVPVDRKMAKLPYDYVLVVDTEGLRAPELGESIHSHDNQLATFVIGLGDVTIMNLKGENVTEISDVLQIAVHAFLRMKLVNQNFQLHRTCLFIHQNVPAINAKEKMRYGCQKLQENLDKMTSVASDAENIVDIHSFNQVIRFDGEKNVYHISDFWFGDPPMAPTNPGYTEKVQEVKQDILHNLFQEEQTFLSFSDLILRVQDLWNGVLSDDFVFSFKNSLAAKAYTNLESVYHENSWTIEKCITDWQIETAAVKLECCSTRKELDECLAQLLNDLERVVSMKKNDVQSHLETFFDNHNLKDILIQWKAEKMATLNSDIQSFITRAKTKLSQLKETVQIDLFHREKEKVHVMDIMEKSNALAERMKGKRANEEELLCAFNEFWIECQKELGTRSTRQPVQIDLEVEKILRQYLRTESGTLLKELREHPLSEHLDTNSLESSIRVEDIEESHLSQCLSVTQKLGQRVKSMVQGNKSLLESRSSAVKAVNTILRTVDTYLCNLRQRDSQFQESYATAVIMEVINGVKEHNKHADDIGFTLLPNLKVKVAVLACRHAVTVFQEMQAEYEENHGAAKKLDAYKNAAWGLFNNMVNQSTVEVVTADLLIDHLEGLVKQMVKRMIYVDAIDYAVQYFGYRKYNLILKIMRDLALKDNFDSYKSFILDAREFSHQWMISFMNEELFAIKGGQASVYQDFANVHIQTYTECIQQGIKKTTKGLLTQDQVSIEMWIKLFRSKLQKLPIREADLEHVMRQNVHDFENLEALLSKRLLTFGNRVLDTFATETAETLRWEGESPYREIIAKLWGCEAQCPFCFEPCQKTAANHVSKGDSHQCIQHRVQGVRGIKWAAGKDKGKLVLETCNSKVMSKDAHFKCNACGNQCRDTDNCSIFKADRTPDGHRYREYKTYLPDWDIAPGCDMESSKYWMWFMANYEDQLVRHYDVKKSGIPDAWKNITREQAINSLSVYVG